MGEAKRRGNTAQRTEEAKQRKNQSLQRMEERINVQIDEELFLFCWNLYAAAAQMTMPVENPATKKIHIEGAGTISFTDNPTNRGMLAVTKELREQDASEAVRFATGIRLMQFGDILDAQERFSRWIHQGYEEGTLSIDDTLIRACGKAKITVSDDEMRFDLDDVERYAQEIERSLDVE